MPDAVQKIDFAILDFIHNSIRTPFLDKIMTFVTTLGDCGAVWIIAAILMLCIKKYRKTGIMLLTGLSLGLLLGNSIIKPLVGRIRPFYLKEGMELIINPPAGYSFPSGHTLSSVISAVIIFLRHKRLGTGALVLAALIAFSRLYLYVHFPTDVLAAIILGILIAFFSVKTINSVFEKNNADPIE